MHLSFLDLPRRSPSCGQCGQSLIKQPLPDRALQEEDFCYSYCEEGKRRDFCRVCWSKNLKDSPAALSKIYFWKTRLAKKGPAAPPARKELRALAYLKEIIGCESKAEEQFFLSLFLMRKKVIIFRKEIEEMGQTYQLFEAATTGELLPIRKLSLSNLDHTRVQKEIAMQLTPQISKELQRPL